MTLASPARLALQASTLAACACREVLKSSEGPEVSASGSFLLKRCSEGYVIASPPVPISTAGACSTGVARRKRGIQKQLE